MAGKPQKKPSEFYTSRKQKEKLSKLYRDKFIKLRNICFSKMKNFSQEDKEDAFTKCLMESHWDIITNHNPQTSVPLDIFLDFCFYKSIQRRLCNPLTKQEEFNRAVMKKEVIFIYREDPYFKIIDESNGKLNIDSFLL